MRVRVPVVIVEDEDGEDHTGRHHALDEVEICPNQGHGVARDGHQLGHDVHEDSEREEDSYS